jgi:hypothetical protein
MARLICCEASATRATTNSRKCGQYNFELHPRRLLCISNRHLLYPDAALASDAFAAQQRNDAMGR